MLRSIVRDRQDAGSCFQSESDCTGGDVACSKLDAAADLVRLVDCPNREEDAVFTAGFCQLVRAFGSHRVLFGTDCPWADQALEVAAIRALPLTSEEKENIFHRNAEKLLQLNI